MITTVGVRTQDHSVKSGALYRTELQGLAIYREHTAP
jgi:hypothetical protein